MKTLKKTLLTLTTLLLIASCSSGTTTMTTTTLTTKTIGTVEKTTNVDAPTTETNSSPPVAASKGLENSESSGTETPTLTTPEAPPPEKNSTTTNTKKVPELEVPTNSNYGTVTATGNALGPYSGPGTETVMIAPELVGFNFDGTPVEILNDGTPKIIGFFAHWCPHCQTELPKVSTWELDENIDLFAVATALSPDRDNWPAKDWFERENFASPVLVDDENNTAAVAYGLQNLPYWVAVSENGTVVAQVAGGLDDEGFKALQDAAIFAIN